MTGSWRWPHVPSVDPLLVRLLRDGEVAGPPSPDWPRLVDEARRQAVLPLVYAWLRRSPKRAERVGAGMAAIRAECARIAARQLELSHVLRTLLAALADAGIACAPLRGPALAERLYGNGGTRPMGDLDLLVRRDDVERVRDQLAARGFRETDRRPGFARAYSYTLELYTEGPLPVIVEPHWTLAYPPLADAIDMAAVWSRCVPGGAAGAPCLALSSEDLLFHLALHLMHADAAPVALGDRPPDPP
jgi:hypothetical protein